MKPEIPFEDRADNINHAIKNYDWRIMRLRNILFLTNPVATICGKSLKEAIAIFLCDTWPKVVNPNTGRIAKWKSNGTNLDVDTPQPKDGDEEHRFFAGEIAEFLNNPEMLTPLKEGLTREILAQTIFLTPGRFAGFCFSVSKNVGVFNVFADWFGSLSKDQQTKLIAAPEWLQALCMHIIWIYANCDGKHTLDAVSFDAVVKAVGTHHEFPTLDIITKIADIGSLDGLAEISTYASDYVGVLRARSDTTAIYTDMDITKFQQFSRLIIA